MFPIDSDLHIHSYLSTCAKDPAQTSERILRYAKENGLKTLCLTNHFWDERVPGASPWYETQNFEHISAALPLPVDEGVRFLFGCETELDKHLQLGLSQKRMDAFDFIVIPTTHFHMRGFTLTEQQASNVQSRAKAWVDRLDAVLSMSLPFHKVGIAHLTCPLIAPTRQEYRAVLDAIPEKELYRLFHKAASLGVGIELNASDMRFAGSEADTVFRPYRVAKACGCKFYCGSDAHAPESLDKAKALFQRAVYGLKLTENDKFELD